MQRATAAWVAVLMGAMGGLGGCSLANRIDACEVAPAADVQVNSLPERDEYPTDGRSLARLPSGLLVAVWTSSSLAHPEEAGHIRARLLRADGTPTGNCTGLGEVQVDTVDESVGRPVVAVGTASDTPVYIAWQASPAGMNPASAPFAVRARILSNRLCPLTGSTGVLTVSDPEDSQGGNRAVTPSIAARADGREAVVTYVTAPLRGRAATPSVRFRPIGTSRNISGALLQNGCDAGDAACTLSTGNQFGQPAMIPLGDSYLAAWPTLTMTGWSIQTVRLARDTTPALPPREVETTPAPYIPPNIALAPLGDGFAMAWDAPRAPTNETTADTDVWLRRYDAASAPTRAAVRVNTAGGRQFNPSVAALGRGAVAVAWVDRRGAGDVVARILDAADRPLFTGLTCDQLEFPVSALRTGVRNAVTLTESAPGVVLATYADSSQTGSDTFGYAVRSRVFTVGAIAPDLR